MSVGLLSPVASTQVPRWPVRERVSPTSRQHLRWCRCMRRIRMRGTLCFAAHRHDGERLSDAGRGPLGRDWAGRAGERARQDDVRERLGSMGVVGPSS